MSGIDKNKEENLEILKWFGDSIKCYVCKMIVRDPYTCQDCETCCCKDCFSSNFICEKCNSKNIMSFTSEFKNAFFSLKIKCKSCEHVAEYNTIEEHERYCFEKVNNSNFINKEESKKGSFLNSYSNVEASQDISNSFVKVDKDINKKEEKKEENNQKEETHFIGNNNIIEELNKNMKLLNDLNDIHSTKELNDELSFFSENHEDKFSKTSLNFFDSLQIKKDKNFYINPLNEIKFSQTPLKNLNEDDRDYSIRSLSIRVTNLEKLCSSLINETQNLRNTLRMITITPQNLDFSDPSKNQIKSLNPNLLTQKGMIIFNPCTLCTKITNVKIQLKCDNCHKDVCPDCYFNCTKCESISCKDCGKCFLCKELKYCYKCKYSCKQCIKNKNAFGKECIKSCEVCLQEEKFCKRCCSFKCKECNKISCLRCIWNCKGCYVSYCVNHPNEDCKICGTKNCSLCLGKCSDCGENTCKSCLIDCKNCISKVCKSCCVNYGKKNEKICKICLKI